MQPARKKTSVIKSQVPSKPAESRLNPWTRNLREITTQTADMPCMFKYPPLCGHNLQNSVSQISPLSKWQQSFVINLQVSQLSHVGIVKQNKPIQFSMIPPKSPSRAMSKAYAGYVKQSLQPSLKLNFPRNYTHSIQRTTRTSFACTINTQNFHTRSRRLVACLISFERSWAIIIAASTSLVLCIFPNTKRWQNYRASLNGEVCQQPD